MQIDEITIWLPAELKAAVQCHAAARNETLQDFFTRAIQETMARDMHPSYTLDGYMCAALVDDLSIGDDNISQRGQ